MKKAEASAQSASIRTSPAEAIWRNQLAIRRRILEEFGKVLTQIATNPESWRTLSFETHEKLCKKLGANSIDYPEFEFWFSRFLRGNFNLHHDRRFDPKARSFTDLPLDVFENIGKYLELEDRLRLRNVCKDIRAQVDNWNLKVTDIYYGDVNSWRVLKKSNSGYYGQPIAFVLPVLKLPKLQLEKLAIPERDEYWNKLIEELNKSNRKLHVKKVEIPYYFRASKIDLHFMIPGVLKEIKLFIKNPKRKEILKIVESEQCQAAKMVYIESETCTSRFPLDVLYHCPRFTLQLGGKPADGLKAKFIKELIRDGKVEKCVVHLANPMYFFNNQYQKTPFLKYFDDENTMVPSRPLLRRFPIPGTNEFYELDYQMTHVRLKRKQ